MGRRQACYTSFPRSVAQLVARLVWDQEVESSNLSAPTRLAVEKQIVLIRPSVQLGRLKMFVTSIGPVEIALKSK